MGAVISPFHDPMLVMEYMVWQVRLVYSDLYLLHLFDMTTSLTAFCASTSSSLFDLLQNETMYTGGDIILQIVRDVSQG